MKNTGARYLVINGEKLKARRLEKGLNQEDLAAIARVSVNTISSYERNASKANIATAREIAKALDMELRELCMGPAVTVCAGPKAGGVISTSVGSSLEDLSFGNYADEVLKMACAGLLKETGSDERVSYAIASFAGYLCVIVERAPELKHHTQEVIAAISPALAASRLDEHQSTQEILWSGIKNHLAKLMDLDCLPLQAKEEAGTLVKNLSQACIDNDSAQKVHVIRLILFWLRDNWKYLCQDQTTYFAWNDVCCVLTGAPTDRYTRLRIVKQVSDFAYYVSLYDPDHRELHKRRKNGKKQDHGNT